MSNYDAIVIGGGIAGVSVGYELAANRDVALLETESALAFHTTGRSAATYLESYGGRVIRLLTTSSRDFLENPPDGFDPPLMSPRPLLWLGPEGRTEVLRALEAEVQEFVPSVHCVSADEAYALCPILRPGYLEIGMVEPDAMDMDVHALHQGYVRGLRQRGGAIHTSTAVAALERADGVWRITDQKGEVHAAPVIVNAAGAWVDAVGRLAGARPIGIQPMRRTIFMIGSPEELGDTRDLPLIGDIDATFYLKPESGQFLCSPADETPSDPVDARPEEVDIARALDAIREATILDGRHVRSSWAGLRNFVADRIPVAGYDDQVEGFFWLAGQGGYGIQTAPALARVAAAVISAAPLPADVAAKGLQASDLDRARLDRPLEPVGH